MRILISGAAGFLGSHLSDLLLSQGHKIIGIDNFITGKPENIAHLRSNRSFALTKADVMDGIAEMIHEVQVEATFPDGTKLVTVHDPIQS